MQLVTFGKVHLTGCDFSRPKPLLLLSYLTLEGPQERRSLAELFWRDKNADKKALQKKLGKLSVVLAQFKKEGAAEVFPNKPGLDPIPSQVACDGVEFLTALDKGDLAGALELYQGPFLHDLGKPLESLDVSGELEDWVLEKREYFAQKAQLAMLELAERTYGAGHLKESRKWAEKAYKLPETPVVEAAVLSRLNSLLTTLGSDLAQATESEVATSLDELSSSARSVLLALSLQDKVNLTIIRTALELSIGELSQAREDLTLNGLIDADSKVLARGMARGWLEERPSERMPLLLALARATPPEGAFELYRAVYGSTQGFGGVGDLPKARAAYCAQAKKLTDALKFADVAEVMSELREAERVAGVEPEPEARFLEAYALERTGRFREALMLLQVLPEGNHNPDITALESVLLWRLGKRDEARRAAESVLGSGLDWLWARAIVTNNLGNLDLSSGDFIGAASEFKKAATLFQAADAKHRWVGSLNNYAVALDSLAEAEEKKGMGQAALEAVRSDTERAYGEALEALDQTGKNPLLRARILLNLGMLWGRRKNWTKAEDFYLQVRPFAEQAGALDLAARLSLNLGHIYLEQQCYDKAKKSLHKAIELAAQAGEVSIQGMAIANLAFIEDDYSAMEVGMDLLSKSGHEDNVSLFLEDYAAVLKRLLERARSQNDTVKERILGAKLADLDKRAFEESHPFSSH